MSFVTEGLDFLGSVSRYLNQQGLQQPLAVQPAQTAVFAQQGALPITRDDFVNMLKEALAEQKSESTDDESAVETVTSAGKKLDVKALFNYLDSNKDGILSADEFKKLDYLFELMQTKI